MEKPTISPDFTIDDIHKIREYNYERTKHLTFDEKEALWENELSAIYEEFPNLRPVPSLVYGEQLMQKTG